MTDQDVTISQLILQIDRIVRHEFSAAQSRGRIALEEGSVLQQVDLAAYPKGDCHMSYTTIRRFWGEVLGIPISRSQWVHGIQKASAAFEEP